LSRLGGPWPRVPGSTARTLRNSFGLLPVLAILIVLATWSDANAAGAQVVLRDDWGRDVRVPVPTRRIVSLAPHATESLLEAGAGPLLVAVDVHSGRDAGVAPELPMLTVWPAVNLEALQALRPDLVIVWGAGLDTRQLARLSSLAPIFVSEPRTIEDVARTVERFAALVPDPSPGRDAAMRLRASVESLRERHGGRPPVTLFYQVWERPLVTVSDRGVIGEAIGVCGARNPFGALPQAAPVVDIEAVLAAAPDLLVVSESVAAARSRWRQLGLWRGRTERVVQIDAARLQRPSPRMVEAMVALCAAVEEARS
jgi:iron complex transport system substrate-binding protein